MPTFNRRDFIPAAIDCFLKQTYEEKELIIVDDGEDKVRDLIPKDPRIRYIQMPMHLTTGCKRNLCNAECRGDIIIHFDDDDWSDTDRIVNQGRRLLSSGKAITGYKNMLYWDVDYRKALYYKGCIDNYVVGCSLCYLKEYWLHHQFPMMQVASDGAFILQSLDQISASGEEGHMVARKHSLNVSNKSNLNNEISKRLIPVDFWQNESLRLNGSGEDK